MSSFPFFVFSIDGVFLDAFKYDVEFFFFFFKLKRPIGLFFFFFFFFSFFSSLYLSTFSTAGPAFLPVQLSHSLVNPFACVSRFAPTYVIIKEKKN